MWFLILGILLAIIPAFLKNVDDKYNGPSLKDRTHKELHNHRHHRW